MFEYFKRKFGNHNNVWGKLNQEENEDLLYCRPGQGVVLGKTPDGPLLRQGNLEHVLVVGTETVGKSAGVVLPTLLEWEKSAVVLDYVAQKYWNTSKQRAGMGQKVLYFNPFDEEGMSVRFNPLELVRMATGYQFGDIEAIAEAVVIHGSRVNENLRCKIAERLEVHFLTGLLHYLFFVHEKDGLPVPTLSDVARFVAKTVEGKEGYGLDVLVERGWDLNGESEEHIWMVLRHLKEILAVYLDPVVAKHFEVCDFSYETLIEKDTPVTLYLVIERWQMEEAMPIYGMFMDLLVGRLLQTRRDDEKSGRLLLMLDDFCALGKMKWVKNGMLLYLEKSGMQAVMVAQWLGQLAKVYGDDLDAILVNVKHKVFFAMNEVETPRYVAGLLGNERMEETIMELPSDEVLIIRLYRKPIIVRKYQYFKENGM